ncbi:hypothetical protein [Nostoc sp.]|uniref:hypothetical protein n=1 Tax=Nostoc sp. TaxID=1180 RepID=UPI002FFB16C8
MTNQTFTNGYALLIGVGADLPVTVKDATAIRDILIDPSRAAYPPEQVKQLDALQAEFDIRSEKFKQMKKAVAIEAGTAVKFQLEQQLLDEETKLTHFSDELDKIESALQS